MNINNKIYSVVLHLEKNLHLKKNRTVVTIFKQQANGVSFSADFFYCLINCISVIIIIFCFNRNIKKSFFIIKII